MIGRLLRSRPVDQALRGASLVVTDRRWAAPLSAAALGFGIFAGVAIGPGAAGTLATGAQQVIELPASGGGEGQSGGGGGGAALAESAPPPGGGEEAAGFEEALPSSLLAPEATEPLPAPAPQPAPEPAPAGGGDEPERSEAQELEGTVVHANQAAGSYTMAIKTGDELVSVHAAELPEPGTVLTAPLRQLANGTFAEAGELEEGRKPAAEVSFRGVVTYADPDPADPAYTVSGRGPSLLVHVEPDPGGAVPVLPAIGTYVTVTAKLVESQGPADPQAAAELVQSKLEAESGPSTTYLDLAGIAGEVTPDGHLLLSADDARESEADLTLTVPAGIDAAKLVPGDSYLATAELGQDGSLTLKGIASDERTKGADDAGSAQGDLAR